MKVSLFQGILIAVFGLGAVVGLFVFATYSGGGTGSDAIGKVVVWGTLPKQDINTALIEVGKIENRLKSISYIEKNPATIASELATAIATDSSPDLVLASQEELLGLRRFIMPIPTSVVSPTTYTSSFIDEAGLFYLPDGSGYYGLPFLVDPLVLYWNNDILSSEGIAKPPATWEAMTGLVPVLAVLTPSKQITRGLIGLGTYDNVRNARGILSALFLQTNSPISSFGSSGFYSASLGSVATAGVSPGEAVLGYYTQFANPNKVAYTWNTSLPDSRQAFQTGDLALYIGYVSEARVIASLNPNLNFNVAPLPQPATASVKTTYGVLYGLMIPRGARNGNGAYQVAALLTNPVQQEIMAREIGLAPASRAVLGTPPASALGAVAYASALYSKGWVSPSPSGVDSVFSSMINSVITGQLQPSSALSRAAGALSIQLQQ